jgi:hypothetical protein
MNINQWIEKKNRKKLERDKYRFGNMRNFVLKRDGYKCIQCGMSNEEHLKLWKKDLTIDHIDGNGSTSKVKNNDLDNLQTLCLRCHARKDGLRTHKLKLKDYKDEVINKYVNEKIPIYILSKQYRVTERVICRTFKIWGIKIRGHKESQTIYMSHIEARNNISKQNTLRAEMRSHLKEIKEELK